MRKMEDVGLIGIAQVKPTWMNKRTGNNIIGKRLDWFLVSDFLVESQQRFKKWVGCGGHSDHFPIFLEFRRGPLKPPSSLKFNKTWLKD